MDPLTMAAVQTGANIIGGVVGSALSRKDRRKAREMERLRRAAVMRSQGLGNQIADYAESVGTPQDAMFYGGLAGSKYKSALDRNKGAFARDLGRRGVNPNSGAFMANFGGDSQDALGEATAYNRAMFDRINEGVGMRERGQSAVMKPFDAAGRIQEENLAAGEAKANMFKDLMGSGMSAYGGASGNNAASSLISANALADKNKSAGYLTPEAYSTANSLAAKTYADQMRDANLWNNIGTSLTR